MSKQNKSGNTSNKNKKYTPNRKNRGSKSPKNTTLAENLPSGGRNNDPNWYFSNALLADQVGQISFQEFLGNGPLVGEDIENATPSIVAILVNPAPGLTYNVTQNDANLGNRSAWPTSFVGDKYASGINIAASKMYNFLASNSGRVSNYAPQDLSAMILAIGALAEHSENIRRVFGVSMLTNPRNRAIPKQLVEAMDVDYDDLLKNSANYRMRFNTEIARINQIPLIGNVAFIRKCRDIFQHLYVDSTSSMSTIFFYAPQSTWVLDEAEYEGGTILKTRDLWGWDGHNLSKISDWLDIMSEQITALLNSTTLNLVYADLINASSKTNFDFWTFDYLAENYSVIPEYNRNALLQLHNMTVLGIPTVPELQTQGVPSGTMYITPFNDVYPDPDENALVYNPGFIIPQASKVSPTTHSDYAGLDDMRQIILDFDIETPDLVDKIEATRFTASFAGYRWPVADDQDKFYAICVNMPDHYVTGININYGAISGAEQIIAPLMVDSLTQYVDTVHANKNQMVDAMNSWSKLTQYLSAIDMAPFATLCYGGTGTTDNGFINPKYINGERNFYTKVPSEWLYRVNRLMFTGLFEFRS